MSAAVTAPPHHSRPSHLNPNSRPTINLAKLNTVSTRTHLANLDRLLVRPPPLPLPLQPKKPAVESPDDAAASPQRSGCDGLLNALNLSTLLPFTRKPAVDEMSPRSLAHLQRLLTMSPRPSPKSSIAAAWRRYHGEGGWDGLLDPLDQNLRRELLRYGDFVQAAYTAFHSMPSSASNSQHRTLVLPDRAYRPTRSLFATSSLSIPPWAQRRSTPKWLTQRSSFVGFVAVCDNEREVQRMGRRDITIVLRGTATCPEWAENLRAGLVPLMDDDGTADGSAQHVAKVARGFLSLYKTPGDNVPSLSNAIVEEVKRLMEVHKGEELSITVVGHSLGASLALLAADELSASLAADKNTNPPPIAVVSFGGPKTGNRAFADRLKNDRKVNVLRVVNAGDVVTRVPGVPPIAREGYVHVGAELRLDSRDSPCLRPDAGPACCHDLEAYLHLVDGFLGSHCPFRANAKRSILRLLKNQGGNVKQLYISKARDMRIHLDAATGDSAASPTTAMANTALECVH